MQIQEQAARLPTLFPPEVAVLHSCVTRVYTTHRNTAGLHSGIKSSMERMANHTEAHVKCAVQSVISLSKHSTPVRREKPEVLSLTRHGSAAGCCFHHTKQMSFPQQQRFRPASHQCEWDCCKTPNCVPVESPQRSLYQPHSQPLTANIQLL